MTALPTGESGFVTLEEYYVLENQSEQKHEYDNGRIIGMAGASDNHVIICVNVTAEIRNRLKGRPCQAKNSDYRIGFPGRTYTHYPDAAIVCGGSEKDPRDQSGQTFTNPTAVIEVLSPSSAVADRTTKFDRYRDLASFREYVIVFQDRPEVQTFFKQPDGTWLFQTFTGLAGDVPLRSVGIVLPLAEIYDRVTFPETPPEPAVPDGAQ